MLTSRRWVARESCLQFSEADAKPAPGEVPSIGGVAPSDGGLHARALKLAVQLRRSGPAWQARLFHPKPIRQQIVPLFSMLGCACMLDLQACAVLAVPVRLLWGILPSVLVGPPGGAACI